MKFCNHCGAPLKDGQKVCTQCGTPVQEQVNQTIDPKPNVNHQQNNTAPPSAHSNQVKNSLSKQQKIMIGAIIGALVLLFGIYKLIENQYSLTHNADKIASAVRDENPEKLSKILTNGFEHLSVDEANAYIKYVKAHDQDFYTNVRNQAKMMKENKQSESQIYSYDTTTLKIQENGKAMGLFKKYDYIVPQKKITLNGQDVSDISFKINGKDKKIHTTPGETINLGSFTLGDYHLKATKTIDKKKYQGHLDFNSGDSSSAKESFGLAFVSVSLDTYYSVDISNQKLFVDGKEIPYDDLYNVGPFKYDKQYTMYATADLDGESFKTNEKTFTPQEGSETSVQLEFDDEEVNAALQKKRNLNAKKSEEQSSRKNLYLTDEEFFQDYMRQNRIQEYKKVKVGMKEAEVIDVLGESDDYIDSSNENLKAYGNIGVEYKNGKVDKILIVPDSYSSLDYDDIEEYYGTPVHSDTNKDGDKRYYLDGNKANGFVIVLVMNDDGNIKYMYQKPEESSDPWR